MTDHGHRPGHQDGGAVGPPWSVDVLADLDAGVLDDKTAAELWPRVSADPEAQAILAALRNTSADLADLGSAPAPRMPDFVAHRIDAALATESARMFGTRAQTSPPAQTSTAEQFRPNAPQPQVAPVIDISRARKRRNQRITWGAGLVAVAAAAVAAIAIIIPNNGTPGSPNTNPPLALKADGSDVAVGEILGVRDYGPLSDQTKLQGCLSANGINPTTAPAGIRPVTIDGKSAMLMIFTTGNLAQFRVIAVEETCSAGTPGIIFDKIIGR